MAIITSNPITFIYGAGEAKYLYIRYSNDGVTFTENNGLTPGSWLGICATNEPTAPTEFQAYQWSKIKGEEGLPGANGADAVYFQIYSVDGFEFSDKIRSIELQTMAFQGYVNIDDNKVSYQWKWWNANSTANDKYESISGATSRVLTVNINDVYAFASIKCEMTYDDITYEDYVSLTKQPVVYTALTKFSNGTNIISSDGEYVIAYVELYKDNQPEELLYTTNIYVSNGNSVSNSIITTDITGSHSSGDMVYFVCRTTNSGVVEYNVVLGKYESSKWNVVPNVYIYKNDLFASTSSHIVFIPKEKIERSLNVNFEIYKEDTIVARTNTMVLDLNDPTISSSAPSDPKTGQLWLDTSIVPNILKMWNGTDWINSGYQNGNVVYTSKPASYTEGDLWILASGEICGNFGPGSMLKANTTSNTFSENHWEDVDAEGTEQKNNIKQYFLFNADTGLRIGQSGDKFYVNISSTEMGFYDKSTGTAKKVVSISNQAATIKNLTIEENATFNCNVIINENNEVKFGNFILKIESNKSLSLAIAT